MLRLVYSKDEAARTKRIDGIITELCAEEKRCFLIVPETAVLAAEKRLFPALDAKVNLFFEVLSFRRLPDRLHREAGGMTNDTVSEGGRAILTSLALSEVGAELKRYDRIYQSESFVLKMSECIANLKSMSIGADELVEAAEKVSDGGLSKKLHDISRVYSAYEALLGKNLDDDSNRMSYVAEKLGEYPFFNGSVVVIDGFVGYTPKEYAIIGRALAQADDVYITIPCDIKSDGDIYKKPLKAAEALKREAGKKSVIVATPEQLEEIPCAFSSLARVKAGLWSGGKDEAKSPDGSVRLIGCDTEAGEAEAAAMLVLGLCAENGYEMRDIALCVADAASYGGIADSVFKRHEIPLYMSVKSDFASTPFYRFIMSSLSAVQNGFLCDDMIALLKTSLTDVPEECADELCCYAKTWNFSGKAWSPELEFKHNPDGFSTNKLSKRGETILKRANHAKPLLMNPLISLKENLASARNARDFAKALFSYAEELGIEKKEEKNAEFLENCGEYYLASCKKQLWGQFCGALDCLVNLCSDKELDMNTFVFLLNLELKSLRLAAIPGSVDEVQMIPASSISGSSPKALIVLGANEGVFPEVPEEDPFFTKEELSLLDTLGIDRGTDAFDYGCEPLRSFQSAVSLPSEKLFVLRLSSKQPSIGFTRIKSVTGEEEEDASKLPAYGINAVCDAYAYTKNAQLGKKLKEKLPERIYDSFGKKLDAQDAKISEKTVDGIIKDKYLLSPSAQEEFRQCMLRGWGGRVLKLREEKSALKLEANDSGTFYHRVFEQFITEMINSGKPASSITPDIIREKLKKYTDEYVNEVLGGFEGKSARFIYLFNRLQSTLEMFLRHIVDDYSQSKFVPWKTECKIGDKDGEIKGLTVTVGDKKEIMITGSADRVDIYRKNGKAYVRIGDYKSGGKKLSKKDIENGYSHQMLAYLFSLCKNAKDEEGCELAFGGVIYYSVRRPKLDKEAFGIDAQAELDEDSIKNGFETNGLLISDIDVIEAMESELDGRFTPYKKRSTVKPVADASEFERLESIVCDYMKKLANELFSGNISAKPDEGSKDACKYCKLEMLCRCKKAVDEY